MIRLSRPFFCLLGLVLAGGLVVSPARAQFWVSGSSAASNSNPCTTAQPCATIDGAINHMVTSGQIDVAGPIQFGAQMLTHPVVIENDGVGTALFCCGSTSGGGGTTPGMMVIAAGPDEVITLRGLTFDGTLVNGSAAGIVIQNAQTVNIENCIFRNTTLPAILVQPVGNGMTPIASNPITVNIVNTTVTDSRTGVQVLSVPNTFVNVVISHSKFLNNFGGGIRIDGSGGGGVTASISDSESSSNTSNGIVALSGPGNVAVNITHSVMASNGLSGVQSNSTNGGTSAVTLNSSTVTNNAAGQINFFGAGASLQTFGDNRIVGPNGTGFTGPVAMQ